MRPEQRANVASARRPAGHTLAARAANDARALTTHVRRAVARLEPGVRSELVARPELVDEALDALARRIGENGSAGIRRLGTPAAEPLSVADGEAWVEERTIRRPLAENEDYAGAREIAELVGISRQAVHARRERGTLIGFFHGRRDALYPREQFDEHGRVVPGVGEVLATFGGDGWQAWSWLTRPCPALDDARPLDRLRQGRVDEVVAAAHGELQGDFA